MERRVHKRVRIFATARFGREGESRAYFGSVTDVSYSGLFLMTPMVFKPGERIWVECAVDGQALKLSGTVVRYKQVSHPQLVTYARGGMGIHIDNMHPHIMNFVDGRLREEARFV